MSSPGLNELKEGAQEFDKFYQKLWQKRLSRRKVFKLSAMAALVGSSGTISQFLAACGEEEKKKAAETGTPAPGAGTPAAGTGTPFAGVTGDWDTIGTPPYKYGLPDDVAKVPEQWKQYPWTYKYGSQWRYNWNIPVTRGGHIIVGFGPPANFDIMVNGYPAQPTNNKLYNATLREGVNLMTAAVERELAIGEEHNADYTSWTFTIPDNVKFHNIAPVNGRPMTAEDVAFSFERHRDTNVNKAILRHVEKITAVDKTHIRFDLKQPMLSFREALASPHFVIFAKEHFENKDLFKARPIGTGPFISEFSEFQNKQELVRNPDYWELPPIKPEKYGKQSLPFADRYTRLYFANPVASKEAFFAGKIDQYPTSGLDTALVREQLQKVPDAIFMTNAYWSCCPPGLYLQQKNPLYQDIRVRKALSMGLNREQVWSGGMDKTGVIGAAPVPFDLMGYDLPLALKEYGPNAQYNPQQAKQLLQEAGYTSPLKVKIYQGPQSAAVYQSILDTVVFNWKQAGIVDPEVVVREAQVLTQDQINKSFPDMVYKGAGALGFGYTVDASVAPAFLANSPANFGSVNDPELEALLDRQARSTNPDDAIKLARQINQRIVDQVHNLWVCWIQGSEIDRAWVHGMVLSNHNCLNCIGVGNMKYPWIDETAPEGRGGKPI